MASCLVNTFHSKVSKSAAQTFRKTCGAAPGVIMKIFLLQNRQIWPSWRDGRKLSHLNPWVSLFRKMCGAASGILMRIFGLPKIGQSSESANLSLGGRFDPQGFEISGRHFLENVWGRTGGHYEKELRAHNDGIFRFGPPGVQLMRSARPNSLNF